MASTPTDDSHVDGVVTVINGNNYSTATLRRWNYTFYPGNNTLSNNSACYLVFANYNPVLFPNGTFTQATSCYTPLNAIQPRGAVALVFGSLFAVTILFTTANLRKHGRSYLTREKRWRAVGRRWQWYWMLFVAATGMLSAFTGVDVDRDYVLGLPMVLQSFFLTLMGPGVNAVLWEAVRHWGSWQQRQIRDADPFTLREGDLRSRIEFFIPLIFYTFDWLVFFMTIPRPWTAVQMQRSPAQTKSVALPMATDVRFKTGEVFSVCGLALTCFSLLHSVYHYRANPSVAMMVSLGLLAARTGYLVAASWMWDVSPYNAKVGLGWLYGLGYGTVLLILLVFNVQGFVHNNDDKVLIAQRSARGDVVDMQLGLGSYSKRPSWWMKSRHERQICHEGLRVHQDLEMKSLPRDTSREEDEDASGSWWWQRRKDAEGSETERRQESIRKGLHSVKGSSMLLQDDAVSKRRTRRDGSPVQSIVSASSGTTLQSRPQVVRSMLDI